MATLAPGAFPDAFRAADGSVAVYFETAAVITILMLLGQVLELKARSQTSNAIKALLGLAPKTARLLRPDGSERDVPLDQVHPGDRLRVSPGERRCQSKIPNTWSGHRTAQIDPEKCRKINGREIRF